MGPEAALPMVLTMVLVCANPMGDTASERGLTAALETTFVADSRVVAASPMPAGIGVGSHYGWRTSTRTGERTFHAGVDFLTPRGTPAYAVRGGIVETVAVEGDHGRRFAGYGNAVVIRHDDDGRWSFYAHLASVDVEPGQYVLPGEKLGDVGNTTNGRFPGMVSHLHFEVREARPDGGSPFPGGYGRHNLDPEAWLADMGVRFDPSADDGSLEPSLVVEHVGHDHGDHDHGETLVADAHFATGAF